MQCPVIGDRMGKGRVLRGKAQRATKLKFHTEWKTVLWGRKACPAGCVLSHWEMGKGGQGRGRAAVEGTGPPPAGPVCLFPGSAGITAPESWKNFKSLGTIHSTNHIPDRQCLRRKQGPASDSQGPGGPD